MKWNEAEEKAIPNGFRVAPRGRYPLRIISAEAQETSSGLSEVALRLAIEGHSEELDGITVFEHLITDSNSKALPYTKTKLRQLGIDVDTDADVPDEELANQLTGQLIWGDLTLEVAKTRNEEGKIVTKYTTDDSGKEVPAKTNRVAAFFSVDVGGAAVHVQPAAGQPQPHEQSAPPVAQPRRAPAQPPAGAAATAPQTPAAQPQFASFPAPNGPAPWQQAKGAPAPTARSAPKAVRTPK